MSPLIEVDHLGKRFKVQSAGACGRPAATRRCAMRFAAGSAVVRRGAGGARVRRVGVPRLLGPQGSILHGGPGRGARRHRAQRRRQIDAAEDPVAHHQADRGQGPAARPGRQSARGGHRLSSGTDGPGEHLSQRGDSRHAPRRDPEQVRPHRRLCRDRAVSGHAGQALLQRHVRPAGLRRGRPSGAGDSDRR